MEQTDFQVSEVLKQFAPSINELFVAATEAAKNKWDDARDLLIRCMDVELVSDGKRFIFRKGDFEGGGHTEEAALANLNASVEVATSAAHGPSADAPLERMIVDASTKEIQWIEVAVK